MMAKINVRLEDGSLQPMTYPDDWSQDQVKASIYKHFPKKEINQEYNSNKGWSGVLKDALSGASQVPSALIEGLKEIPSEANESFTQLYSNPARFAENLAIGFNKGARGALNTIPIIGNYLKEKGIRNGNNWGMWAGEPGALTELEQNALQLSSQQNPIYNQQKADQFLEGAASFLPYLLAPGSEAGGLAGLGARSGLAGLQAIGQKQNPITNALTVALSEMAPRTAIKGTQKVLNSSEIPSDLIAKYMRGNLSPEEIQANLRASEGTQTPLGRVLEEPKLNTIFENITSPIIMGGGKDILNSLKNQIETKGENLVSSLAPKNVSGDLNDLTQNILKQAHEKQKNAKNELYKKRNQIADESGFVLNTSNFEKMAQERSESIKNSPLYLDDPSFKSQYDRMLKYKKALQKEYFDVEILGNKKRSDSKEIINKRSLENPREIEILNQYGEPIDIQSYAYKGASPDLTEAQVTAGDLYKRGENLQRSPNAKEQILGKNLKDLSTALRSDIEESIQKASPELQKAHKEANENYSKNYSPFLDEEIYDKIKEKEPQKIINEIIKPGKKNDQYRDIEKINALLPPEQKNLLGYAYLKKAEDKNGFLNPKEIASLVNALGNRQFKALFPDEKLRKSVLDYTKLRGMNEKSLNVMFNAENGAKTIPFLQGAFMATNPLKGVAAIGATRIANRMLTNEKFRNKVINKIVENDKKNKK